MITIILLRSPQGDEVYFIGARGSGENHLNGFNGFGPEVAKMASAAANVLSSYHI